MAAPQELIFSVDNMSCAGCAARVEKTWQAWPILAAPQSPLSKVAACVVPARARLAAKMVGVSFMKCPDWVRSKALCATQLARVMKIWFTFEVWGGRI